MFFYLCANIQKLKYAPQFWLYCRRPMPARSSQFKPILFAFHCQMKRSVFSQQTALFNCRCIRLFDIYWSVFPLFFWKLSIFAYFNVRVCLSGCVCSIIAIIYTGFLFVLWKSIFDTNSTYIRVDGIEIEVKSEYLTRMAI